MSRARNLKPGFFKNDLLAECDPLARLLFAGLWCEADRSGRLENRPKRLKAECLPYDDCDIDALLGQLEARGFIVRYVVDGQAYIAIPEFSKHQNPHIKEAESTIPAPCLSGAKPEQAGLIPDSPSLIPVSSSLQADACPHSEILALYHELLPANPRMKVWNGSRAANLRSRWREDAKRQTLDYWRRFFTHVAKSEFLTGRAVGKDTKPFLPGLDWLVLPNNFAKVIEGKYHDRG